VWGTAIEVPGTPALNVGGGAKVFSVSCVSAGNCSAGGQYEDATFFFQAFVVTEKNGVWGTAIEVPGTAALNNAEGVAETTSVSCASAGHCTAGGYYTDANFFLQPFLVTETDGVWGTAVQVPGTADLNAGGTAQISSVSCAPGGGCGAGGPYRDASSAYQAFVISQ
jgi:hypothetical protein